MSVRPVVAVCVLLGLELIVDQADAGSITTFNDRIAFNVEVGGPVTVETFTSTYHFPISTGMLNSSTNLIVADGIPILPGDIQRGVTYSTAIGASNFFNIDASGGFIGGFLDGFLQDFPNTLTTTFTGPVRAFGFDTNELTGSSLSVSVHFLSGPDYIASYSIVGDSFFGFKSSAQDIISAQILGDGSPYFSFALDNFTFTELDAVETPEPASLTIFGIGLAGIAGYGCRRQKVRKCKGR